MDSQFSSLRVVPALAKFQELVESGAECSELFAFRNAVRPDASLLKLINGELRRLGCPHADAVRTDGAVSGFARGLERIAYTVGYAIATHDRERLFDEAGTHDYERAAKWYAAGSVEGVSRMSAYAGCLDALRGERSKFAG